MACVETPNKNLCPETTNNSICSPFQLSKLDKKALCFIDSVVNENLNIGGADVNVFKLLGTHEQGNLIDLTGNGNPISSGSPTAFPPSNAFDIFVSEWRSSQLGQAVIDSAFIGYDFGEIKLDNGRERYGIDTFVRHNIATIRIKQGSNSLNRVTRARIERSDDGIKWFGAAILTLPDNDDLNTINFKHTVPSRRWRIRPLEFNGGPTSHWAVQALEMIDFNATSIDNIQDPIFQENRDRDYASESQLIKAYYDLLDVQTELTKFGIELPGQTFYLTVGFTSSVEVLGRPLVIGDILELPSETQFSATLEPIKKFLEVTDVAWSTEGYTPGWTPTLQRVIAQPLMATVETQDLFEGLSQETDSTGLSKYGLVDLEGITGEHPFFQDNISESQTVAAEANTNKPERGSDTADITQFSEEQIQNADDQGLPNLQKISLRPNALYVEDGLPPNGEDFTEGDILPSNPKDGDYHRLTFSNIDTDIPPRLFRFSVVKNRWIFLESDKRKEFNRTKPRMAEFFKAPISNKKIK